MTEPAPAQIEPPAARSPRRAIAVIVLVLAIGWLLFPGGVANWVEDQCENDSPFCSTVESVADAVDGASRGLGIAGTMEGWRDAIRAALGIDFY